MENSIGANIRRIRKAAGMTQEQLGEQLGVTQAAVRQMELRNSNPTIKSLKKVALALDVSVIELLLPALSESEAEILHQAFTRGYQTGYETAKKEVLARMKSWLGEKEDEPDGENKDHEKAPG